MTKFIFGIVLSVLLSSAAFAQIPVTDGANLTQQIFSHGETLIRWKSQYEQMVSQIQNQQKQYEALTGTRNLGTIMNDPAMKNYLPANWQGVYDSVRNGGYSGLSGRGQSVYNGSKVFDGCAHIETSDERKACEARAVKGSQDKAFALDAYDAAVKRLGQIDGLMQKINSTSDPKSIAELQGRIAIEQANIQNEQIKLQLYAMVAAAEDKVQAQRQREMNARTWSATKGIEAQPLTFK